MTYVFSIFSMYFYFYFFYFWFIFFIGAPELDAGFFVRHFFILYFLVAVWMRVVTPLVYTIVILLLPLLFCFPLSFPPSVWFLFHLPTLRLCCFALGTPHTYTPQPVWPLMVHLPTFVSLRPVYGFLLMPRLHDLWLLLHVQKILSHQ